MMWKEMTFAWKYFLSIYLQVIRKIAKSFITRMRWNMGKKFRNCNTRIQNSSRPDTIMPGRLNFERCSLIFVGHPYGTCLMSPFWRLEFWGLFHILGKFVHHCIIGKSLVKASPKPSVLKISMLYRSRYFTTVHVTPFHYCTHHIISLLYTSRPYTTLQVRLCYYPVRHISSLLHTLGFVSTPYLTLLYYCVSHAVTAVYVMLFHYSIRHAISLQYTSRHFTTVYVTPFHYCIRHAISLLYTSLNFTPEKITL
jgi:hypothetical protein